MDPFAPKRKVTTAEAMDPLQEVLQRLERCGATKEDLAIVEENWPPDPELLHYYYAATDDELAAEIKRVQDELDYATLTDEQLAAKEAGVALGTLAEQAAEVCAAGNRAEVEAWVAHDPLARAQAVLEVEPAGKNRSTLLDAMKAIVDASAT